VSSAAARAMQVVRVIPEEVAHSPPPWPYLNFKKKVIKVFVVYSEKAKEVIASSVVKVVE